MSTRTERYPVICPDCGETRALRYAATWAIRRGLNSGTCDLCAKKKRRRPHIQRVIEKIGPTDTNGCWPWMGNRTNRGYGGARNEHGRGTTAYREVYEILIGPIPEGLELDHLCRNPACVNPEHLEPVTGAENKRRAAEANYSPVCPRGHVFDSVNTYVGKDGYRKCRACRRDKAREKYGVQRCL